MRKTTISSPDAVAFSRPSRSLPRRRTKTPAFSPAGGGGGRRSRPGTPLLRWKFDDVVIPDPSADPPPPRNNRNAAATSSRKLAAGIWRLQQPSDATRSNLGFEAKTGHHLHIPHECGHPSSFNTNAEAKSKNPKNGMMHKLGASSALPDSAGEGATKWDPGFSRASDEVYRIYNHLKLLEDQQVTSDSVVTTLQAELELARCRIGELEAERQSSKEKLDHHLRKLEEEKVSWRSREHEKIRSLVAAMKDDLRRERKNRQRMEIVNSKLAKELTEVRLSAKRFLQDYEKERKDRELMEEVCDELAKEIAEDKAEVENLKMNSMKMNEEVDEERKMLQMAEVWREERVQMKLIDAKLMLEEKYSQISKLQADIEAFLRTRSSSNPEVPEIVEAEMLRDAANLVIVQEIKDFSYQPPLASDDIFSVFEEMQQKEDINEREIDLEIDQCYGYSLTGLASKQTSSPDIDGLLKEQLKRCAERNGNVDDDSDWETVSQLEEQGFSNSPGGSDPSVNGNCKGSSASLSATDWEENGNLDKFSCEIREAYSSLTKQSRKKASSLIKLWRSSSTNNGENPKKHSIETTNKRLSNGRMSNATLSPARNSEGGLSSPSIGQWSSPDSLNAHITRGMKGCIDWPRGVQKQSLKSKLLEATVENQKTQLRHVLKQKI